MGLRHLRLRDACAPPRERTGIIFIPLGMGWRFGRFPHRGGSQAGARKGEGRCRRSNPVSVRSSEIAQMAKRIAINETVASPAVTFDINDPAFQKILAEAVAARMAVEQPVKGNRYELPRPQCQRARA